MLLWQRAFGAVAGALAGGAVGSSLDNIDAKSRAQIAAATGHASGAVNVDDVITMTRSGIDEQIIVNQIAGAGLQRPLGANDVIYLQQNGVSPRVIYVMQQTRVAIKDVWPGRDSVRICHMLRIGDTNATTKNRAGAIDSLTIHLYTTHS